VLAQLLVLLLVLVLVLLLVLVLVLVLVPRTSYSAAPGSGSAQGAHTPASRLCQQPSQQPSTHNTIRAAAGVWHCGPAAPQRLAWL
jgi:hypothetical protein